MSSDLAGPAPDRLRRGRPAGVGREHAQIARRGEATGAMTPLAVVRELLDEMMRSLELKD